MVNVMIQACISLCLFNFSQKGVLSKFYSRNNMWEAAWLGVGRLFIVKSRLQFSPNMFQHVCYGLWGQTKQITAGVLWN